MPNACAAGDVFSFQIAVVALAANVKGVGIFYAVD